MSTPAPRSRRAFLARTRDFAVGGASAFLLACRNEAATRQASAVTATATPLPKRGGVLRMAQGSDILPEAGHPFALAAQNRTLLYATDETVLQYDHDLNPSLLLAERFELSPDGLRAVLTLQQGLEFHNHAPVTASDVLFGIEVMKDPAKYGITRALELAGFASMVADAKVEDRTIEFTFDRSRMNITDFFAQLNVTPRASYGDPNGRFIGTGPFALKEWRKGQGYTLEAFDNWHGRAGGAYLDGVEVSLSGDQGVAAAGVRGGALDAYLAIGAPNAIAVPASLVHVAPKTGMAYVGVNVTNPLLADARVRQAIFWGIDRNQMLRQAGGGFGHVTAQPWGPSSPAFEPAREAAFFDVTKAKALLAEAGFKQPRPLAIEFPAGVAALEAQATILQQNFKAIGIDTVLNEDDVVVFTNKYRGPGFADMWLASHAFADLAPLTLFEQALEFSSPNVSGYQSARYSQLIGQLEDLAPQSDAAKAVYAALNTLIMDDAWVVPIGMPVIRIDLVGSRVRGWPADDAYILAITGKVPFEDLWLDV